MLLKYNCNAGSRFLGDLPSQWHMGDVFCATLQISGYVHSHFHGEPWQPPEEGNGTP